MAPRIRAQTGAPIPVRALSHMTLTVTDPARSIEFYQALFGMPIQARQGPTTVLRVGPGPQFLALNGGPNAKPGINHFCMTTDRFDVDRLLTILAEHGVTKAEAGGRGGGLSGGAMKARIRMRMPDQGGAKDGTAELYVGDPDGLVVQLQDTTYCGGGGVRGEICTAPEASPHKGVIAVRDLSHFTLFVSDADRSRAFYQGIFGMPIQVHQGPATPLLAVGSRGQFLTIVGVRGAEPAINHVCMTMENFDPDKVIKTLSEFGIKPRADARGPAGPLTSYISMRMENRGGAKEGTPELYFTDPDGILLQLQDVTYCGGAGRLGELCS
jgi:catechol 2,3-dioxygenase-like lactoylglutathione lyase family enzyme